MATRFYLPSTGANPDHNITIHGAWSNSGSQPNAHQKMDTTKSNSAMATRTRSTDTTSGARTSIMATFISAPIGAQTISGTIRLQILAAESSNSANTTLAIHVWLANADGTYKSTLVTTTNVIAASDNTSSPYELPLTTLTNRRVYDSAEQQPITLTQQTAANGDHIVVEIGFREAVTSAYTISMRFGDVSGSTDLGDNTTDTTQTLCPYVEFSQNIDFNFRYYQTLAVTETTTPSILKIKTIGKSILAQMVAGGATCGSPPTELLSENQKYVETDVSDFGYNNVSSLTRVTDVYHQGTASARATCNGAGNAQLFFTTMAPTVIPGHDMTCKAWGRFHANTIGSKTVALVFNWYLDGNPVSYSFEEVSLSSIGNDTWYYFDYTYEVPAGVNGCNVAIGMVGASNGDYIWYDEGTFYDPSTGGGSYPCPKLTATKQTGGLTQKSLTVAMVTVPTLARKQYGKLLSVIEVVTRSIGRKVSKTLPVTEVTNRTLNKKMFRTLPVTEVTNRTLSVKKTYKKLLSGTEIAIGTIKRTIKKTLPVTEVTNRTLIKNVKKTLAVTEVTNRAFNKKMFKTFTMQEVSVPNISKGKIQYRTLPVTETVSRTINTLKTKGKILTATSTTIPTIKRKINKYLTVQSVGLRTLNKKMFKTLSRQETSVPTITRGKTFYRSLIRQEVTIPTISRIRTLKKSLSVQMVGLRTISKKISKTLSVQSSPTRTLTNKKTYYKLLSRISTTLPSLTIGGDNRRSLLVTEVTNVSIKRIVGKRLSVISTTVPRLFKKMSKGLVVTEISNPLLSKGRSLKKTLPATMTGILTLTTVLTKTVIKKTLSATTSGTVSIGRSIGKTFGVTSTAHPTILKTMSKTLSAVTIGIGSIIIDKKYLEYFYNVVIPTFKNYAVTVPVEESRNVFIIIDEVYDGVVESVKTWNLEFILSKIFGDD